jgi:glycosyltransferase involved in cell wall biosynthesis
MAQRRGLAAVAPPDILVRALARNDDELDVLIVHGMFNPFAPRLARAARRGGIRTIAQPHDPYAPAVFAERRLSKALYWITFERPFLRSVDAIQLYAPSHHQHLVRLGVETPAFVVPAGISDVALARAAKVRMTRLDEPRDHVRLLFLGRFDIHNKGLDLLLEAIARTPAVRSQVQLECVGACEASEYAAVDQIIRRLGLSGSVSLSYRTDDPWSAFARADLFVLSSRFDGFAQVVLESLAVGTPAIVSSAAGAAEFLSADDAVVLARPSVADLGRALLDAISRLAELQKAARDAHDRIACTLTWTACARQWVKKVEQLELVESTGERGAGPPVIGWTSAD